jgi:glucose-1-phosphatase
MINKNNLEAIIFDLGGVILNLDYQLTINAFKSLGIDDFEAMYTQAKQNDLFDRFETGQISSQHFINSLLPYLPNGTSPNHVVKAWNAMILDFPLERLNFIDQLRSKYRIFLLSNTNEIHLQAVKRALAKTTERTLESYFEVTYVSHEMNMRKPNQAIFERVCTENNLNPASTLFIDDTIGHIDGAQKIGLMTHHLTNGQVIEEMFIKD